MKSNLLFSFILFTIFNSFGQKTDYAITKIPDSLKQNADAVVRFCQTDIKIVSQREMTVNTYKVITVFNKAGLNSIDAVEYYSKNSLIKNVSATIFDAYSTEIKKIKRKDFRDQAILDGVTLFSDNRVLYLDYTPTQYPFTIVYESETKTSNTAFIPSWYPISNYYVSVEKNILNVSYPTDLGFKKKEVSFGNFNIKNNTNTATQLRYELTNCTALKPETLAPASNFFPKLMLGLESFNLEGIDGNAKSWKEFGKWYSEKILTGTIDLPEETKLKIKSLVGNETDPIKKAKIVYQFVQDKSRYVSIQVGVGGWKPMLAKDVDRLGYGDCKALSNYTKALLDVVNVPSYNTILYGDRNKKSIDSDFVSMQGNHMILCVPKNDDYLFLECTSQTDPFGYQANFTDDRDVLIIKPEGGEIVHTTIYEDKNNLQKSIGNYSITEDGQLIGSISISNEGTQYSNKSRIENLLPTEKEARLKEYWDNIDNLKLLKTNFINDKEAVIFTENITISAENYAKNMGNNLIFPINAYNQYANNLKKIRSRKTPFEIQRGFYDTDQITITIPQKLKVESLPENYQLKTKFGDYKTEISKISETEYLYKRDFTINKGQHSKSDYEQYRLFLEQVSRNDNAKIVLLKNN